MRRALIVTALVLAAVGASHAGSLTVQSPNGGEQLKNATNVEITWNASGLAGKKVKLSLMKNNSVVGEIAAGVDAMAGKYTWKVGQLAGGKTATIGGGYKVRVSVEGGSAKDNSNAPFSISLSLAASSLQPGGGVTAKPVEITGAGQTPMVKAKPFEPPEVTVLNVTNPQEGDRWEEGESQIVTWTTNLRDPFTISLYNSTGMSKVKDIVVNQPASGGAQQQYRWTIGSDAVGSSGSYKIRVTMGDVNALSGKFYLENHLQVSRKTYLVPLTVTNRWHGDARRDGHSSHTVFEADPGFGRMMIGVSNLWHDEDDWSYQVYMSHLYADVSKFEGKGLLTGASLHFTLYFLNDADAAPVVHALEEHWYGTTDQLFNIKLAATDAGNLTQRVTQWLANPSANHGLLVTSGHAESPLPWHHMAKHLGYYKDIYLELEFAEGSE